MPNLQAAQLAVCVFALGMGLFYARRMYYLIFCAVLLIGVGLWSLEYAPILWLPIDFAFTLRDMFYAPKRAKRIA